MSDLQLVVAVGRVGRLTPQDGTELRIAVVGPAIGQVPDQYIVVVRKELTGAQRKWPVGVAAVLEVEGDGPTGTRAVVPGAAVIGPAMVETHVPLGNDHRDLDDGGVVVGR